MTSSLRIAGVATAVLSIAALNACHHNPPASVPAPVTQASGPNADSIRRAQEDAARRAAEDAARRRAADSAAAAEAARRAAAARGSLAAALTAMVHFDYDQAELRAEDRSILDAKVPILQANSGVTIQVAGHTDERGSDEYNLALGQRRAAAVKAYLVQHGVADSRISTVSYGEEHPIAQGADESAWAQNRRAEFAITAGANNLRSP
ncbi:MAG TPA: peptidoglycan-associated lipoprotein Pal [Gemmatimonadaceae bacterium]|nr:peptidoglycan-associated lipoprotein Pal [Gemmatimonadaceae bacterium]